MSGLVSDLVVGRKLWLVQGTSVRSQEGGAVKLGMELVMELALRVLLPLTPAMVPAPH